MSGPGDFSYSARDFANARLAPAPAELKAQSLRLLIQHLRIARNGLTQHELPAPLLAELQEACIALGDEILVLQGKNAP